jgi:hypothetical protein
MNLEQQRDAVGEAVDIEAWPQLTATETDCRLHDEGVPFQHFGIPCTQPLPPSEHSLAHAFV